MPSKTLRQVLSLECHLFLPYVPYIYIQATGLRIALRALSVFCFGLFCFFCLRVGSGFETRATAEADHFYDRSISE